VGIVSDFSDQFEHFVPPSQEIIHNGITDGLVVLDSNVLLSAYRFAPKSRAELLKVLESIGSRIWIPHQVGLEFHRNRLKVIADYDAAYKDVIEAFVRHKDEFEPELEKKIRELSNRVALPDDERDDLLGILRSSFSKLDQALKSLQSSHGIGAPAAPDAILKKIGGILTGKVGQSPTKDEEEVDKVEAALRIEKKMPPGYRDSNKDEPHGDYFVWCQTLREVQRRRSAVLVFVTSDAKEDWYLRLKGQTVMARPELARECLTEANARLVMLPARQFLAYAKKYLEADVSDETIRQAERASRVNDIERAEAVQRHLDELSVLESSLTHELESVERERRFVHTALERCGKGLADAIGRQTALRESRQSGREVAEVELLDAERMVLEYHVKMQLLKADLDHLNRRYASETDALDVARATNEVVGRNYGEISRLLSRR
jgi:hypothetical protein